MNPTGVVSQSILSRVRGPMEISHEAEMMYNATMRNALTTYDMMIKEGVSPEQADPFYHRT